jgi:signal transduction histidine kinase
VFAGHHVLDCTNAVSNVLINVGQSIEFDVLGSANANFTTSSSTSKAFYIDVHHETADAAVIYAALGSNIDFSTLTVNNVSSAAYTHSSGGGGGGGTTPPPVAPNPKPKPTTPKTPPSTSILSPPSTSSESAGGPQESVLKDQINNFAVSKRSGFLQRFSDTAAISINWLLLLILLIIAGLYSWRARKEYLARKRLESALSRLRGTKQALDTYLAITTHYLNTPLAIMNGAVELLASLRKLPEWAIANLQSKLKKYSADVTQLGTAAQLVTAASDTHDLPSAGVAMIGTVSHKSSPLKQRAVWVPIAIVTTLLILATFLFTHAHVYTLSLVQTGLQILCLILAAGLIAFAHNNRDVQLTAQAVAQASIATEQQLVNQRTIFMSQASSSLADNYENLSIASKDFHIIPETRTFYNGLGMLGATVSSLAKTTQLTNLSSDNPLLNLKQEVTRTLSELQPQTEAKHLQIQVSIPDDLEASTQPEQLKQLVRSVIDNAIKFNKDSGTIDISAHPARKQVVIRVTDNGIGIPTERLPHMFEPFYRATDTETYDYQGLGLSLYTDKLIVEQLGGKIELSSSSNGTTVQITLPKAGKATNSVPRLVTPTVQAG